MLRGALADYRTVPSFPALLAHRTIKEMALSSRPVASSSRKLLPAALAFAFTALTGCGTAPEITNTEVQPSTWSVSGISDTVQFTVKTDVLHLGGTITKVHAAVQGQNLGFDLVKQESIAAGERWGISTQLTLWTGLSKGTYHIDITATDDKGTTVTETDAATVTVTD